MGGVPGTTTGTEFSSLTIVGVGPLNVDTHCPVEVSQILTVSSSLTLDRDLLSGFHFTVLMSLKEFKSVSMHKNTCFEKVRGMFSRNLP